MSTSRGWRVGENAPRRSRKLEHRKFGTGAQEILEDCFTSLQKDANVACVEFVRKLDRARSDSRQERPSKP